MIMRYLALRTHWGFATLAALLFAVTAWTSAALTQHETGTLRLGDYDEYRCGTGSISTAAGTLSILTATSSNAKALADKLCAAPTISHHYDAVRISWKPRALLTAQQLLEEEYDLIWSREHYLLGLVPDLAAYYDTLMRYENYSVYWVSKESTPILSAAYFSDKKVGLLKDERSHTHYQLPLRSMKAAGLNARAENVQHYDDIAALYSDFASGELDLISAGKMFDTQITQPLQHTLIDDHATAATFFVRRAITDDKILCALTSALAIYDVFFEDTRRHVFRLNPC